MGKVLLDTEASPLNAEKGQFVHLLDPLPKVSGRTDRNRQVISAEELGDRVITSENHLAEVGSAVGAPPASRRSRVDTTW